jgi:hypothetical protein
VDYVKTVENIDGIVVVLVKNSLNFASPNSSFEISSLNPPKILSIFQNFKNFRTASQHQNLIQTPQQVTDCTQNKSH